MKNKLKKATIISLAVALLVGGTLGIVKDLYPGLDWLSLRALFGVGNTFTPETTPLYVTIYGAVLAVFEIAGGLLIFCRTKHALPVAAGVLALSAIGCVIAILLGDLFAIVSLALRLIALALLWWAKSAYPPAPH